MLNDKDKKILIDLYRIHSPSNGEKRISLFVQEQLDKIHVEYKIIDDQIYNIIPDTPLISAHMDQVGITPISKVWMYNNCLFGDGNLGADDKNGIWILLNILKEVKDISFIFSTGEEAGCNIQDILKLKDEEENLKSIKYGLVFDRRGNSDIIGEWNDYCKIDLETDILKVSKSFGFRRGHGTFSDCDILSLYKIPCVNISSGYYNAHSTNEFTNLIDIEKSLKLGKHILTELSAYYNRAENNYSYGMYGISDYYYSDNGCWESNSNSNSNSNNNYQTKDIKYLNYHSKDVTYLEFENWGCRLNNDSTSTSKDFYFNTIEDEEEDDDNKIYFCPSCDLYFDEEDICDTEYCSYCQDNLIETVMEDDSDYVDQHLIWFCIQCDLYYSTNNTINCGDECIICGSTLMKDTSICKNNGRII